MNRRNVCRVIAGASVAVVVGAKVTTVPKRALLPLEWEIPYSRLPWKEGDPSFDVVFFDLEDLNRVGGEERLVAEVKALGEFAYWRDSSGCSWKVCDRSGKRNGKVAVILRPPYLERYQIISPGLGMPNPLLPRMRTVQA